MLRAAGPAQAQVPNAYILAVGDELLLDFLDDEGEPSPVRVGSRGDAHLPYIGSVSLAGLSLEQARDQVAAEYVRQGIFVAPLIELTLRNLHPVSILGDVRAPGFYDYRPLLTVEQAVGLAGGPAVGVNNEETRTLQRAALRGEIEAIDVSITREVVALARLQSQLRGEASITDQAPQHFGGTPLAPGLVEQLQQDEESILLVELANFEAQIGLINRSVEEAHAELELVGEQIQMQELRIENLSEERPLLQRGLQSGPALARLERAEADEQVQLLRLRAHLAQTQRSVLGLERELKRLEFERQQQWHHEAAQRRVALAQLVAQRRATLNRLNLLAEWTGRMASREGEVELEYRLRRRTEGGTVTLSATETEELLPGDVVLVRASAWEPVVDLGQ